MRRTLLLAIAVLAFAVSGQANPFVAGVVKPLGHEAKNLVTWKDWKLNIALFAYGGAIAADFYTASRAQARCSTCTVIGGTDGELISAEIVAPGGNTLANIKVVIPYE